MKQTQIMIKHSIKDDVLYISIAKTDFSYRIPVSKISNTIDWKIGQKGTDGIIIKAVSKWMLQLFTKAITEEKYIKQFKSIIEELNSENTIHWEDTLLAVKMQNEYNWMVKTNSAAKKEISEEEIISTLKKKYKLD